MGLGDDLSSDESKAPRSDFWPRYLNAGVEGQEAVFEALERESSPKVDVDLARFSEGCDSAKGCMGTHCVYSTGTRTVLVVPTGSLTAISRVNPYEL